MNRLAFSAMAVLLAGCSSDEPREVFRLDGSSETTHFVVIPTSIRSAGEERIVQVQMRFSRVKKGSYLDVNRVDAIQVVYAFDCEARNSRELTMIVTHIEGKTSTEKVKPGKEDVLPETPKEAIMDYACDSSFGRWRQRNSGPVVRKGP